MSNLVYLKNATTLVYSKDKCTGCGMCVTVCPHAVFRRANSKVAVVNRDNCMECGACQKNCAAGAIRVKSGVGCATAVINRMLGRQKACCVADGGCDTSSCC